MSDSSTTVDSSSVCKLLDKSGEEKKNCPCKFLDQSFHSPSDTFTCHIFHCHRLVFLPLLYQVYPHIISIASHATKFVNLYTEASVFLRNVLLENNSPFEQHNDFICC
jgi:hypothetical protein